MKIISRLREESRTCETGFLTITVLMLITVLIGIVYLIFAPKQSFSDDENRVLESVPGISLSTITDGSFMNSIESYVGDHFMLRKAFVSMNTQVQLWMGRKDLGGNYSITPAEGGVYFGKSDHIYEVLLPNRSDTFRNNIAALNTFAKTASLPFYFMPIPSGSQEQPENLPDYAPNYDQIQDLNEIKTIAAKNTKIIDLFGILSDTTGNDYYYKTDHHWNTNGAYEGYKALVAEMGLPAVQKESYDFKPVSEPFYGTLYSKAVLTSQVPDVLYLPVMKKPMRITQQTGTQIRKSLIWEDYLQKKDKYSAFLGGNHSVDIVKNADVTNGRKLLIVKDSYANSMVPFLATNFSEIHIIDLRYYNQNVYNYLKENKITEIAAIYSIKQLCDISISNKLRPRS